ncbi:hypothetical protein OG948_37825 (plasmid) [Embleya sp. NBC_00888]|uniref:hypothetical protein n=1 Tax=Embleya sp. NBC_00888 TaxID=2975960 RepID=UPI002F918671|nr:hypothetical protein OG948_37825 [Embleya sp. NBC_00888]
MTDTEAIALALAIVCSRAEEIRTRLRNSPVGGDAALEELLTAARGGGRTADRLDVLHAILQALGDARGLYAYGDDGRVENRDVHAAGLGRVESATDLVYLCPDSRCTRSWWPQGSAPVPHCVVSGSTLRRDRL